MKSEIRFFNPQEEEVHEYTFSIILARYKQSWIWVRHRDRQTWELPAGHIEPGESAMDAGHRELFEETGAIVYQLEPMVAYEGVLNGEKVFGQIFLANIEELGPLPEFEIAEIRLLDIAPPALTYPHIQPLFFNYGEKWFQERFGGE